MENTNKKELVENKFKKSKLYLELKDEVSRLMIHNRYFEAKLILDLICNLDSCIFNNIVLLSRDLYDRYNNDYCYYFTDLLNKFIIDNNIKVEPKSEEK